jgi:hypothetical protein
MSHHLDSPIARQDIRLDITDLYVFRGQTGTVFAINVCHSIFGPIPAPGYHPEGMYDFKIDLNGDALEDLAYRFTFSERDAQGKQKYTVRRLTGADAADPQAAGTVVAQGTTDESVTTPSGLRVWAEKPAILSGSSPTCCTRWATRFKMARLLTSPVGIRRKRKIFSPAIPCIRWSWKFPTRSCSRRRTPWPTPAPTEAKIRASASGRSRFWLPMPAAGATSIASGCR